MIRYIQFIKSFFIFFEESEFKEIIIKKDGLLQPALAWRPTE
jgi:hypothetical protein